MSIWVSWQTIGWDDEGEAVGGMVIDDNGIRNPQPHWNSGQVRAYAEGWSNHYPDETVEPPAAVDLATIPVWCVPGHVDDLDETVGPWLRLELGAENAPDYWQKNDQGEPTRRSFHEAVVLDEDAARALRDDLTSWLDLPKTYPDLAAETAARLELDEHRPSEEDVSA